VKRIANQAKMAANNALIGRKNSTMVEERMAGLGGHDVDAGRLGDYLLLLGCWSRWFGRCDAC
jgi:hypothetical protein